MNRELILAHSGGYIIARTCSLFGNEGTPQISNASFWKRGRENVFVQMFCNLFIPVACLQAHVCLVFCFVVVCYTPTLGVFRF